MLYPKNNYESARAFKGKKRGDAKNVRSAFKILRTGCAYTPAYDLILQADELLLKIEESLSVKKWGR